MAEPERSPSRAAREARMPVVLRTVAVLAPPLIVLVCSLVLYAALERQQESRGWIDHTYGVIDDLDELGIRLVEAESAQRGFLISGDTSFLAPYRRAVAGVTRLLSAVRGETADNPRQQATLAGLEPLVERRLDVLQQRIDIYGDGDGLARVRADLARVNGRAVMDSVRSRLADMEGEERRLLALRSDDERRRTTILDVLLAATTLAVAGTSVLSTGLFRRYGRATERLNEELQDKNELLQEQAAEQELLMDELQTQAASLEETAMELEATNEELMDQRLTVEALATELTVSNDGLMSVNARLMERTVEAEEANRAKSEFLAAMSHELRTPLNAIGGYVDLMQMGIHGPVTPQQGQAMERIQRNQAHLLSLISDILNFAKIEAGKLELHTEAVPVSEVLDEVEALIAPQVAAKGLVLRSAAVPASLAVRGDRERIEQIVLNLLTNAVKYTEAGEVTLWAEAAGDVARIHVRDTGPGIAREKHDTVFDPFVQLARMGGMAQDTGVGLGLSIARELARSMEGDVTVESVVGDGSTFTLTLPIA